MLEVSAGAILAEFARFAAAHSADVLRLVRAFWQTRPDLGPVPPDLRADFAAVDAEIDKELKR